MCAESVELAMHQVRVTIGTKLLGAIVQSATPIAATPTRKRRLHNDGPVKRDVGNLTGPVAWLRGSYQQCDFTGHPPALLHCWQRLWPKSRDRTKSFTGGEFGVAPELWPQRRWNADRAVPVTDYALYLDDSGHPDSESVFVVAGYVATEEQWKAFEPRWQAALKRFGLGDVFHMTDFMRERMTALRRDQILSTLANVVHANTIRPFVRVVTMPVYKKLNEEFTLEECHGAPYALTARALAKEVNEWRAANLQDDDNLTVFVEQGTKHFGDLMQVFKRDKISIPTVVPKALPRVQPADVLAWEHFQYLRDHPLGSRPGKNLERLVRPIRKKQDVEGIMQESDLRTLCVGTDVPKRHRCLVKLFFRDLGCPHREALTR